MAVKSEHFW